MTIRSAIFLHSIILFTAAARAQDAASLIARGDSLLMAGQVQQALTSYDIAAEIDPGARSHVARARALYLLDHMDAFILEVELALRLDSTNAEAHYQRALYAMRGQDHRRAERECTSALAHGARDPLRREALLLRGEARAAMGRNAEALSDLEEGMTGDARDTEAMVLFSRLLDANGRHEESLAILQRLCELEPKEVGHWINRGFELAALGRHEEAIAMYDAALALDKDEPVALSDRAHSLMQLGRDAEALKNVERSLRFYPANAFALRTRGALLLKKGEREKACADLSLARVLGGVDDVDAMIREHCGGLTTGRP